MIAPQNLPRLMLLREANVLVFVPDAAVQATNYAPACYGEIVKLQRYRGNRSFGSLRPRQHAVHTIGATAQFTPFRRLIGPRVRVRSFPQWGPLGAAPIASRIIRHPFYVEQGSTSE
jgi:hypothetical protein